MPKCSLTLLKVPDSSSRVSPSILRIASSSVVMASVRSAVCASRKLLRSRAVVSSSSAARLTAPSAAISRCRRSISPCRPGRRTLPSAIDCASASRSAWASASSWVYCSRPRRAACSLSWKSVMRWRSGSSSRSSCRRRSSLARSLAVRSSYSLRCAPSCCSRSSFRASALCRPACAAASVRRDQLVLGALFARRPARAACCAAVSIARASSAWRAARLRWAKAGLLGLALQAALLLAARRRACARPRSRVHPAGHGAPGCRPAACRALQSAPSAVTRRSCRSSSWASTSARSPAICSLRARVCSASCDRRSVSTCSSCARLCASAASRRADDQALRRRRRRRPRRAPARSALRR